MTHLKTEVEKVAKAVHGVSLGLGIRDSAELFQLKPRTIQRWIYRAGIQAEYVQQSFIRNLDPMMVQVDEIWTFVGKKVLTTRDRYTNQPKGVYWVWLAIDVKNRLILASHVGRRTQADANFFIDKIFSRIDPQYVFWASDRLKYYKRALIKKYQEFDQLRAIESQGVLYGRVIKVKKRSQVVEVDTELVWGSSRKAKHILQALAQKAINTSYIERLNLTIRDGNRKLHRRPLAFAKTLRGLQVQVSFQVSYYNFCKTHRSLKQLLPVEQQQKNRKWLHRRPAMAAGLTDHCWTLEELLLFQSRYHYNPYPPICSILDNDLLKDKTSESSEIIFRLPRTVTQIDPSCLTPITQDTQALESTLDADLPSILLQIESYFQNEDTYAVTIQYQDQKGQITDRTVVPYQLVTIRQTNYLKAFCFLRNEDRMFTVENILRIRLLTYHKPESKSYTLAPSEPLPLDDFKVPKSFPGTIGRPVIYLPEACQPRLDLDYLKKRRLSQLPLESDSELDNLPKYTGLDPEGFLNQLHDRVALLIWQFLFWCYPQFQSFDDIQEGVGLTVITVYKGLKRLLYYDLIELTSGPPDLLESHSDQGFYKLTDSSMTFYLEPP